MSGGGGGGAQQAAHSLAFRVMRLCRPTLHVDTSPLKFDPCDLLFGEDLFDDPIAASHLPRLLSSQSNTSAADPSDLSYRSRFLLQHPTDSLGLPGLLVLPQAFGAIYLGETFCSYISINNSSNFEVRDVVIKAEIQTERQRLLLLDTSKSLVESIRAGGRYDFIVEHDVKELGAHTLVCTALYTDGDSERKYLPQFFKFMVSNPLSVRTKVRNVKDTTFLEACIENHTKSNLYMDQVEFEPAQYWSATVLKAADHSSEPNSLMRETFKEPILIRSGGGIYNYLYQLKFSSPDNSQFKVESSKILGKLQITWRTNLGEPGRLQTQHILGNPVTRKDIELHAVEIPPVIILEKSFLVSLNLINLTDRVLGPFEVWLSESDSLDEKAVMVNGLQTMTLGEVQAFSSLKFQLNLIAVKHGIQKISGITVFDTVEKRNMIIDQPLVIKMALNLQAVQRRARAAAAGGNPPSAPVAPPSKQPSGQNTSPPQTEDKSKDKGKASASASKKRKPAPGQGKSKRVMQKLAEERGKDLARSSNSPSKSIESVSEIQGSKQAKIQLLGFNLDGDGDAQASAAWSLGNMSMHDIDRRERLFSALREQYHELRSDKRPIMPSVPEVVRHKPDWNINFNLDGFLGSSVGETTYEAYKYLHLPADRERLARMHYLKMEEYFAHVQMQGMVFGRELAVKCAQFHVGMLEAERNLKVALDENAKLREETASKEKIKQYKDEIASLGSKIEQYKADLSSKSKDLTAKEEALVQVRDELTKEVDRNEELKKELDEKVIEAERRGRQAGRSEFLASDEYKALMAKHRLDGASDFRKSSTYESNVIGRAGDFLVQGFELCMAQANHLGAFRPDVDCSKMSPFVDALLNPPAEDPDASTSEIVADAEFASLLD